jgi:cell division protein FtsQ
VTDRRALIALDVLAAAPAGLRDRLDRATTGREGVVVEMRDGPDLIFGAAERARAKWLAAARVLADPGAAGAVYLDLRIPERVAAGGVGPLPTDEPSVPGSATATTTTATATVTAPATSSTATDPAVPAATPTPVPTATPAPTAPPAGTPETTAGGTAANPQP